MTTVNTTPHTIPTTELRDLAGPSEIGAALGVTAAAVTNWSARYPDFPEPLLTLATGRIWSLSAVLAWHARRQS